MLTHSAYSVNASIELMNASIYFDRIFQMCVRFAIQNFHAEFKSVLLTKINRLLFK